MYVGVSIVGRDIAANICFDRWLLISVLASKNVNKRKISLRNSWAEPQRHLPFLLHMFVNVADTTKLVKP